MKYKSLIVLSLLVSSAEPSFSEESSTPLVIVTANRTEIPRGSLGSSHSVIERKEIEAKKHLSVLELLRTQPGVNIVQSGGKGRQASVFLRGANSNHTLVLIDGIRVNSNNTGAYDLADLKAENIEKIEIIRGPQSVVYGSEAIGGVINIITQKSSAEKIKADISAGTDSTYQAKLGFNVPNESINNSSSISFLDTNGFSTASSGTEDDSHKNFSASTRLETSFLGDGSIDLTARYSDSETDLDGFTFGEGPTDDVNSIQKRETLVSSLTFKKKINDWLTPALQIGYASDDLNGEDPDTEFSNYDIDSDETQINLTADILPFEGSKSNLGFSFSDRNGKNKGSYDEKEQVRSIFINNQHAFSENIHLGLGVRNDNYSSFGNETTYRATLSTLIPESNSRIHASYGTGFRAPNFADLYFPNFGNPDLNPETSKGFDIGLEQVLLDESLVLDLTFFKNDFEDLISFDFTEGKTININSANAKGFEFGANYQACEKMNLLFNYTYTDSEDETTNSQLARRPKHKGSLDLFLEPTQKITGVLSFIVVKDRVDSDQGKMDNYERLDLSLTYKLRKDLTPYIRIENLLDEDYEEIPGFATAGFEALVGLEFKI